MKLAHVMCLRVMQLRGYKVLWGVRFAPLPKSGGRVSQVSCCVSVYKRVTSDSSHNPMPGQRIIRFKQLAINIA